MRGGRDRRTDRTDGREGRTDGTDGRDGRTDDSTLEPITLEDTDVCDTAVTQSTVQSSVHAQLCD